MIVLTVSLTGSITSPVSAQAVTEAQLEEMQLVLGRAVEALEQAASEDDARHLIQTHTQVPFEDLESTGRRSGDVAPEAMAARIVSRSLAEVSAEVEAGTSVAVLILQSSADPGTAVARTALLTWALNLHAYIAPAGLPDADEDGLPNSRDPDADGDGLDNWMDPDVDGDGVDNQFDPDVDGDGLDNILDDDVDGDSLINIDDDDIDGDGVINAFDDDIDGDGFANDTDGYSGLPPWVDLNAGEGDGGGADTPGGGGPGDDGTGGDGGTGGTGGDDSPDGGVDEADSDSGASPASDSSDGADSDSDAADSDAGDSDSD
ncbi:MAG: hypothetical protein GY719_33865 [bacterium]|nr:hypothetical protein [bacterium]